MALDYFHGVITNTLTVKLVLNKLKPRKIVYHDNGELIGFDPISLKGIMVESILNKANGRCYIDISGSLHKYYNCKIYGKEQNFDDFTFTSQVKALYILANDLNCELVYVILKSFEYSVNIRCGLPPNELIHKMYYYDKRKIPTENEYINKGYKIEFKSDSYKLKIYNKSQEAKLFSKVGLKDLNDLLRIELKYNDKNACVTIAGVESLADFKDTSTANFLYSTLQKDWKKVLMYDSQVLPESLNRNEKKWFIKCNVSKYFLDPSKEHFKGINQTRINHYKKFTDILDKYNYRSGYFELTKLIEYKCSFLMNQENGLIESVMETIYIALLKAPKVTHTFLMDEIITLFSSSIIESKATNLFEQALQRLKSAGHIEVIQSNSISYKAI